MQESTHEVQKSASRAGGLAGCSSSFMRLAEHLKGASSFVRAMSAWSVKKTRRASFRQCRDARVNGLRIRAMHEMSPPPPSRMRGEI